MRAVLPPSIPSSCYAHESALNDRYTIRIFPGSAQHYKDVIKLSGYGRVLSIHFRESKCLEHVGTFPCRKAVEPHKPVEISSYLQALLPIVCWIK